MRNGDSMSLVTLLKENPDFIKRLEIVAEEIDKDKVKIKAIATTYNERYKKEIQEGTKKKYMLLEQGYREGKSTEEVEKSSGFIPSVYTPILNWLYFFILEGEDLDNESKRLREDEMYRTLLQEDVQLPEAAPDMETYIYGNLTLEKFQTLKKLKRLSKSPNENEAFQAYRKCLEMCKQHNIDFDRVPT